MEAFHVYLKASKTHPHVTCSENKQRCIKILTIKSTHHIHYSLNLENHIIIYSKGGVVIETTLYNYIIYDPDVIISIIVIDLVQYSVVM